MRIALIVIIFVLASGFLLVGVLSFSRKIPLLNNTYTEEDKKKNVDKKPYYIQAGIIFTIIGLGFAFEGANLLTDIYALLILFYILMGSVIIFTIVSTVLMSNKKSEKEIEGE